MKYYLSSYKLGDKPEQLKELFFTWRKIGFIPNACDHVKEDREAREWHVKRNIDRLNALWLQTSLLDLHEFFGKEWELRETIKQLNWVFVLWWDVFVLRHAMHLSGFDTIIKEKTKDQFFVYSGYSAGCCVLAPSLDAYKIVDDPTRNPYNSDPTIWEWLNLYPNVILPHYKSDHPESAMIDKEVSYCIENGIMFETMKDGEVIIID